MRVPKTKAATYPGQKALEAAGRPLVEPLARRWAGSAIQRLTGFWVIWNVYGGDTQRIVQESGLSRSSVYASREEFRRVFHVSPDEWHHELAALLRATGPEFYRMPAPAAHELRVTAGGNIEEVAGDGGA